MGAYTETGAGGSFDFGTLASGDIETRLHGLADAAAYEADSSSCEAASWETFRPLVAEALAATILKDDETSETLRRITAADITVELPKPLEIVVPAKYAAGDQNA